MISFRCTRLSPGLILSTTAVRCRGGGAKVVDRKAALHLAGRYEGGRTVAEAVWQMGKKPGFAALVLEGRHRFRGAELRYAGWRYEHRFLNLSSGSKSADLRSTVNLSAIGLTFSDRRSGQSGALIKTIVAPADRWQLICSVLHAGRRDARNLDVMPAVVWRLGAVSELRADYLVRGRRRKESPNPGFVWTGRTRVEYRRRLPGTYLRCYVSYESSGADDGRWGLFADVRAAVPGGGEIELWAHAARLDLHGPALERAYGFLQLSHPMVDELRLALKVTLSYSRSATRRHSQSFILVLEAPL